MRENEAFSSSTDERQVFEEWKERMSYIVEDLNWLLKLPHDLFWCQVIFDTSLHQLLDSFLLYAPRHYDRELIKDYCKPIQSKVCKFIFLTIIRMSTDKESDENYISSSVYGEIIYENFLFDIPKLLDICSILCGKENRNRDILSKIVHNVFNKQPRYLDDLEDALSTLFDTLDQMSEKLGLASERAMSGPVKLSDREGELSQAEIVDISLYLYDVCNTIYPFLVSYPPATKIFERKNAFTRFAFLYDTLFPEVIAKLKNSSDQLWLLQCRKATKCLLAICHLILNNSIPTGSQPSSKDDMGHGKLEMFVHAMSSVLTYKRFLCDYDKLYGIETDFDNLTCESECVDRTHITFVLDAVKRAKQELQIPDAANSPAGAVASSSHDVTESDIGEKLTRLRDVLPDFDVKLLERSLRHFAGDEAAAANAILEGSLPAEINNVPQGSDTVQAMLPSNTKSESRIADLTERPGRPLGLKTTGKVYRKQNNIPDDDLLSILSDQENRDYVLGYVDNLEQKVPGFDEYDDEYDDTYDSQNVGAIDADSADELGDLTSRRGFVTPMVLRKPGDNHHYDKDHDSSSPEENGGKDKKHNATAPNSEKAQLRTSTKSLRGGANIYKDTPSRQNHSGKSERGKIKDSKENRKNERDDRFLPRGGKADDRGSKRQSSARGTGSRRGGKPSRANTSERGNREQHWKESRSYRDISPDVSRRGQDNMGQSGLATVGSSSVGGAVESMEANSAKRGVDNLNETADTSEREENTGRWGSDNRSRGEMRGGGGGGGGGSARGKDRGKWHDKHHRKDKAAQKFARGMGPLPRD